MAEPLPSPLRRGLLLGSLAALARPLLVQAQADETRRCIVRPSQTEGPFFVDRRLERADLRSASGETAPLPGVPLRLRFRVSQAGPGRCVPAAGVIVDVWHCDANGTYSEVDAYGRLAPDGRGFLRGFQRTDAAGEAEFLTIYPGWYPGRAVHVHFKLRVPPAAGHGQEFTSQLYFDDALTARVHRHPAYADHAGRRTPNARDGIFRRGGEQLMLDLVPEGEGYAGLFDIALRPD